MDEFTWDSLMVKYAQGTISDAERIQLLEWVNESDENRKRLEETQAIWQATPYPTHEMDFATSLELEKLLGQISSTEPLPSKQPVHYRTKNGFILRLQWVWRIAAAIVLLVGAYFFISNRLSPLKPVPFTQQQTSGQEKQRYTLPDGTIVWLNTQSQLTYPSAFASQIREVSLSGEAFFEVVKDSQRPFVIHAGRTVTQVLGTSFNLRALSGEESVEISVLSGKVNFFLEGQPAGNVLLTPGMKGYCLKKSDSVYRETRVDPNVLAWQNNRLVFNNTQLKEIIRVIEKQFRISIQVAVPEILSCRFTSTFEDAKLTEVLDALALSLDLRYAHTGSRYILTGQGCS